MQIAAKYNYLAFFCPYRQLLEKTILFYFVPFVIFEMVLGNRVCGFFSVVGRKTFL